MGTPLYSRVGLLKRDLIELYKVVGKRAQAFRNYPEDLDGDYTYYLRLGKLSSAMILAKSLDPEYYMSLCVNGEDEPREVSNLIETDFWGCMLPALYSFANLLDAHNFGNDYGKRMMYFNQTVQEFCIIHNYYFSSYISLNDSSQGCLKVTMEWQLECKGDGAEGRDRVRGKLILPQNIKNSDVLKALCIQACKSALRGCDEVLLFDKDEKTYLEKTKTVIKRSKA